MTINLKFNEIVTPINKNNIEIMKITINCTKITETVIFAQFIAGNIVLTTASQYHD